MKHKQFLAPSLLATCSLSFALVATAQLPELPGSTSLGGIGVDPSSLKGKSASEPEPIVLNPLNDYLREAKQLTLPLAESIQFSDAARSFAYKIQAPPAGSALWNMRFSLTNNASSATVLSLVTVEFDEHQRVIGFEELLKQNSIGDIAVDELQWPTKPVYIIGSTNPATSASLSITALDTNFFSLEANGAYTGNTALITAAPVTEQFEFTWKPTQATGEQPLWDMKLLSEPGASYSLQIRSGTQTARAIGAKGQNLTFKNYAGSNSEVRLLVKPTGKVFSPVVFVTNQQTELLAHHERELDKPQMLTFGQSATGDISHRDASGRQNPETDIWHFEIPGDSETGEEKPVQIQITATNAANTVNFALKQPGRSSPLLSKTARSDLNSGTLLLQPGDYQLAVSAKEIGTRYRVQADWAQQDAGNREKEPNNSIQDANIIVPKKVTKGDLSQGSDDDFFLLDTRGTGAAQYWRLIATGGGVKRMGLGKKYWIEAHQDDNNPALGMNYMLLLPGVHEIKLSGDGNYSFRAIPLGPPKPGFEIEPNDGKLGPSERLALGETARGSLDKAVVSGGSDIDQYRFAIETRGKYRISLVSPQDNGIQARLYLNGGEWFSHKQNTTAGSTLEYDAKLLAGEYIIELTNQDKLRALDEYALRVESLADNADVNNEPNDIVGFSTPLAGSGAATSETVFTTMSSLGAFDYTDCYSMGATAEPGTIEITAPDSYQVKFIDRYARPKSTLVSRDLNNKALWNIQPHDETLFLCISRDWHADDAGPYSLSLSKGATTPYPSTQLSTTQLPDALRGGLNVAWHGLGARWEPLEADAATRTTDSAIKRLNRAINNISPLGAGVEWSASNNHADTYRLNLAGDTSVPLAGIVVNTRTDKSVRRKTRHFRLLVSEDGVSFSEAMLGELRFTNEDQYFVFNQPVNARYIKFLPQDSFENRSPHYARFQELKLIASPSYVPVQATTDLASVAAGGHVVRHDFKALPRNNADRLDAAILDPQQTEPNEKPKRCIFLPKTNTAEWVVGFHHNRAARVKQLAYSPDSATGGTAGTTGTAIESAPQFESLTVSVSATSPLGPWRELATWDAQALQAPPHIPMDDAPWVRFIKFVATGKEKTAYQCPGDITAIEMEPGNEYRSILGEWSQYGSSGPFEEANPPFARSYPAKGGASADSAVAITAQDTVKSSVKRERNDDWFLYRSDGSNPKANSLLIRIAHPVSFKPSVSVLDGNGKILQAMVDVAPEPGASSRYDKGFDNLPLGWTSTDYTAWRSDHPEYAIHIQEPPRNVVLTWDSSGSMGPQLPYIEMASRRWANYLKPDHEYAKIMKFAGPSQPENEWANLPHMLQAALHVVSSKKGGSSDAENSLLDANELLAPRYGNHAIVASTDGEFPRSKTYWDYLQNHCSTVYAAGLGGGAAGEDFELQSVYQDNFQNWVSACGGNYRYCDSVTCLEDFYEFAAQDIRKPKPYQLKVGEVYRAPPKPGLLNVTAGSKTLAATAKALYVILDASGSMLQQLEGKRRIDIAKATLQQVARENLGQHNEFGMRTFGLKVNDCHHERTLPIAKHTASAIDTAIGKVTAVNNAKTPIAASLEAAAADLASYPGEKLIVLLTDGEETCDGDSEAILNSLRAQDIDVKMHIVGFALDDAALIEHFKSWATLGGGEYYDAGNQSALQSALRKAVTPRFEVRNSVGDSVLIAHLGDTTHSLPPGDYVISLPDYPEVQPRQLELKAGGEETVEFE